MSSNFISGERGAIKKLSSVKRPPIISALKNSPKEEINPKNQQTQSVQRKNQISKENLTLLNKFVFNKNFICCRESRIEGPTSFYSAFYIGPFEESFSLTLAYNLRRTLLSELTGLAILAVEIDGVLHRFSNLSGVKETTIDILSNLQNIVFKKTSISPDGSMAEYQQTSKYGQFNSSNFTNIMTNQIAYVRTRGPGIVTAADIILPSGIECVNPDKHIATLAEDGMFNMRVIITEGKNSIKQKLGSSNSKYSWGLGHNPADQSAVSNLTNPKVEDFSNIPNPMAELNWDPWDDGSTLNSIDLNFPDARKGKAQEFQKLQTEMYPVGGHNPKSLNSNLIYLDSVFMPVTKVNSFVETNPKATDIVLENSGEYRNLNSKTILEVLDTFLGESGGSVGQEGDVFLKKEFTNSVNSEIDTMMPLNNVEDQSTEKEKASSFPTKKAFFTVVQTDSKSNKSNFSFEEPTLERNAPATLRPHIKDLNESFFELVPNNSSKSETLTSIPNLNASINLDYPLESTILVKLPKNQCHIVLEIWTNGSIHPRQALDSALDFLTTTLLTLKNVKQLGSMYKSDFTYKKILKDSI